jgi:AcrR family transcriptional regulator
MSRFAMHRKPLEPRKQPIQRRSLTTVAELLLAAAQVFEEQGYAAGTTNRIAARAGVSIGTLYQYFPNKEALAVALLERHVEETVRRLEEWVGHMVAERHALRDALRDYGATMLEVHAGRPRLQHILLEETPLPERVHEALLEAERRAARTVAGLLRLYPEVRHGTIEHAGFLVVQAVESLTHRYSAHPNEPLITQEQFLEELVSLLHAYLTCPATSSTTARATAVGFAVSDRASVAQPAERRAGRGPTGRS